MFGNPDCQGSWNTDQSAGGRFPLTLTGSDTGVGIADQVFWDSQRKHIVRASIRSLPSSCSFVVTGLLGGLLPWTETVSALMTMRMLRHAQTQ
jgi:hypothetical protein